MDMSKMISLGTKAIKIYSAIENEKIADLFSEIAPMEEERGNVGQFISECLESGEVDSLKKYLIVAQSIANKEGGISSPIGQLVASVDNVVEIVKAAYDIATGKMDAHVAASKIVDRITLRAISAADVYIDRAVMGVNIMCDAISAECPPFAVVSPVIKTLSAKFSPKIKEVVAKGIRKLGENAKPIIAKAIGNIQKKTQERLQKSLSYSR